MDKKNREREYAGYSSGFMKFIKGPMSKYVVLASQIEAWVCVIICAFFAWFDKDISSLITIVTVSWAGYEVVKSAYIWMAKCEHVEELKLKYKDNEDSSLDEISNNLKSDL